MYERLISLIGKENLKKIQNTNILIVGIGGVGGFALESLVRSGFQNITIIDGDTIDKSNLNRQIITNNKNLGKLKGEEATKRYIDINDNLNLTVHNIYLTKENFNTYINTNYDYIIDACDDIPIKIELMKYAQNKHIKVISALGTGKKLNPEYLKITTLDKTENDPFAKRKENLSLKVPVVFSSENAINTQNIIGSCIFVPSVAGIYLANYIFLDIIKAQDNS